MAKIVTMGEIMLRLSTSGNQRFVQASGFDSLYGGSEANVAISLANYGDEAVYVSKVPAHEIGQCAINELRKYGVNTDFVARGGDRLGIYYLEIGASMRASKVIYDRAGSAMAEADVEDFDFDKIFEGTDWFHWTGITTAISDKAAEVMRQALISAKKHNVLVSCEINYRKKLWSEEKAIKVLKPLMQYVDVFFGNENTAVQSLGFKIDESQFKGKTPLEREKMVLKQIAKEYDFKYIFSTTRTSYSASHNGLRASMYDADKNEILLTKEYDISPIVDRVGGGDSFCGAMIHSFLKYPNDKQKALEFAIAASALKHTITGDYNLVNEDEVFALMGGDTSGRIQR